MNADHLKNRSLTLKASTPGQGRPGQGVPIDLHGCVLEPIYVQHYPPPVRIVSENEGRLALLVALDEAFAYEGQCWRFCVVTNRYAGDSIADAGERAVVSAVSLCHSVGEDPSAWLYAFSHAVASIGAPQ